MRYPNYEHYEPAPTPLLHTFATFFAAHDTFNKQYAHLGKNLRPATTALERAGRAIGQGCFSLIAQNNPQRAKLQFKNAKREIKAVSPPLEKGFKEVAQRAQLTWLSAHLMEMRNQPATIEKVREEFHGSVINSLVRASTAEQLAANGTLTAARGFVAEMTALALVTRYKHPWLLATPAFEHHDQSDNPATNYDMLLIESGPHTDEGLSHKVQVKRECLGYCSDGQCKNPAYNQQYNDDIIMVSGCCDLGLSYGFDGTDTVSLLIDEHQGIADNAAITRLDHVTNNMLFAITSEDRRRGTIPTLA